MYSFVHFSLPLLMILAINDGAPVDTFTKDSLNTFFSGSTITTTPSSTTIKTTTTQEDEVNAADKGNWIVNSGKLALGISPMKSNAICYTGNCRSDGYGIEIFKFDYTKIPVGTCTTKLIPEHVTVSLVNSREDV